MSASRLYSITTRGEGAYSTLPAPREEVGHASDELSGRDMVGSWLIGRIHSGRNSRDRNARSVYVAGKVPHSITWVR